MEKRPAVWRVVLLSLVLVPLNAFWVTTVEVRWYTLDGTSLPLPVTPICILFALVIGNKLWRRMGRAGLHRDELRLCYALTAFSCAFAGHDTGQNLFGMVSHPLWFATPENRWQALFFRFLPPFLYVTDHDALLPFYRGNVSIYSPAGQKFLLAWVVPLAVWGLFFLALVGMFLCLTILVRRAWVDDEKLTFPLIQLPLAMTADDNGAEFWRSKLLWAGFAVAFCVSVLNGLGTLFPALPTLPTKLTELQPYFVTKPWSSVGSTQISFYPFAIGIVYFMPLDLAFSCWFFYLLARVFRILGLVFWMGQRPANAFPFFGEQSVGAWAMFSSLVIASGWKKVTAQKLNGPERMVQRRALVCLAVGAISLFAFARIIGMSGWAALVFFALVFLFGIAVARVRAELGTPHEIVWADPVKALVTVFGTATLGSQTLTSLSLMHWFNRGDRNHPMPFELETYKLLNSGTTENPPLFGVGTVTKLLVFGAIWSLLSTYWANLHITYAAGAAAKAAGFKWWPGAESFAPLASWLRTPTPPSQNGTWAIMGGALLCLALSLLRAKFVWWTLHPAGYCLAISYAMEYFWLPVLLAWLVKGLLVRYGGARGFRSGVPFFLGLILGDYSAGGLWAIIGPLMHIPTYKIYI